ncbi:MAG: DUF948 domain-containing protein [Gemmatimonadota bacterium]
MMAAPLTESALLQAGAEATRIVVERNILEQIGLVGQALTSILVLALLIAATMTLLALRKGLDELTRLVRNTSSDITAAVHDARKVADELRTMTTRVRGSVETVSRGVETVTRGLGGASSAVAAIRKQRRRRRRGAGGGTRELPADGEDSGESRPPAPDAG